MKMKKSLSILLVAALLVSVSSVFFNTAADETAGSTEFPAQHLDIDFSNYTITTNNMNQIANVDQWSIKGEGNNKFLSFDLAKDYTSVPNIGQTSFVLNSDGYYKWNANERFFELADGGVYRLSFKYLLSATDSVSIRVYKYKNSQNTNNSDTNNRGLLNICEYNGESKDVAFVTLDKTNDWKTATIIFTADNLDSAWKNYLALQLWLNYGKQIANTVSCQIDDIQVDRVAAVNVKAGDNTTAYYVAAPCKNSKYLFSGTEDFEGDDISDIINSTEEIYTEGKSTAAATVSGLYTDEACTNKVEAIENIFAITPDNTYTYNCYKKTITTENQIAFVGFDESPSKRTDMNRPTDDSVYKVNTVFDKAYNDSLFTIIENEGYTGSKCLKYNYTGYVKEHISDSSRYFYNQLYIGNGVGLEFGKSYQIAFYVKLAPNGTYDDKKINVYGLASSYLSASAKYKNSQVADKKTVTLTDEWQRVELYYTPANGSDALLSPVIGFGEYNSSYQKCDFLIDSISVSEIMNSGEANGILSAECKSGTLSGTPYTVKGAGALVKPVGVADELVYNTTSAKILKTEDNSFSGSELKTVVTMAEGDTRSSAARSYIKLESGDIVYTPSYAITNYSKDSAISYDIDLDFSARYILGDVNNDMSIDICDLVATSLLNNNEELDYAIADNKIDESELKVKILNQVEDPKKKNSLT